MPKASKEVSAIPDKPTRGRADLARPRNMTDEEINRNSPPELRDIPDSFWVNARVVEPVTKQAISIRIDTDVVEWFRATGPRYQTRINSVLRSYVDQFGKPTQAQPKKAR